jgi:tetratricopeptide (TPR) repeat protein
MTDAAQSLQRARAMLDVRRNAEAVALLGQTVAADPGNGTAWCLLSLAQLRCGEFVAAVEAAGRAAALAPSDPWPHRLLSSAQLNMGSANAAVREATEACRLAPADWRSWVCQAEAALGTRSDYLTAEQAAAEARRLGPDEAEVYYVSGRVSFAREKWKEAAAYQERALALAPSHSGALNELGRINLKRRNAAGAAEHFIQAARAAPDQTAYGRNVEAAVRSLIGRLIYLATLGCWIVVVITFNWHASRVFAIAGLGAVTIASALLVAVRVRRMPAATRPLLRSRRVGLAMGTVFGAILIALAASVVTPGTALSGVLAVAGLLVLASRFVAYAILRRSPTPARSRST